MHLIIHEYLIDFSMVSIILHGFQGACSAQHASCEHLECRLRQNCVGCKGSTGCCHCAGTSVGFSLKFISGWFKVHFRLVQSFLRFI